MNIQPEVMKGYYIDNKNVVHRLINFALIDNHELWEEMVIYQPQQNMPNVPDYILFAAPKEIFFENINMHTPRFRFLGRIEDDVMQALKQCELDVKPDFKNSDMLSQNIEELIFTHYTIRGLALHSKTMNPYLIYNKGEIQKLMILGAKEFFNMSSIRHYNKTFAKYVDEINAAAKILK